MNILGNHNYIRLDGLDINSYGKQLSTQTPEEVATFQRMSVQGIDSFALPDNTENVFRLQAEIIPRTITASGNFAQIRTEKTNDDMAERESDDNNAFWWRSNNQVTSLGEVEIEKQCTSFSPMIDFATIG